MKKVNISVSETTKSKALVISKDNKKLLSKNQIAFNKLTDQIEKAKKNVANKKDKLDYALRLFANDLSPLKSQLIENRKELLLVLWDLYKSERLSKTDQRYFKSIVREHLQSLFYEMTAEPEAVLKAIFEELEKMNYNKLEAMRKEDMRNELLAILKNMNVDLSQIDMNDEKALEGKIIEVQQKQKFKKEQAEKDAAYNQQQAKEKSSKQVKVNSEKKSIDALKQKNISSIYKQLAKLFHPDLELDEEKKTQKVLLMQELTAAYESKDLYALLNLELKWLQTDGDYLDKLEDDKLAAYLQLLKEQFNELNTQKNNIPFQSQYATLINEFGWEVSLAPVETIMQHVNEAKKQIHAFKENIDLLKSEMALRYMKQLIKEWKSQQMRY
jgi:DNA-binding transcriptional regulator YbjK